MFHDLSRAIVRFLINRMGMPYDTLMILPLIISIVYLYFNRGQWKEGAPWSRYNMVIAVILGLASLIGEVELITNRSMTTGHQTGLRPEGSA